MGRILAIDYGRKRTGLAVTDPAQIIANGLCTVETHRLWDYLCGYVAAERAGAAGLSVVLFEKRTLGGVCLNEGCIPTKTLLYSAKVYDYTRHADQYGVTVDGSSVNFGAVFKRKEKVVRKLVAGVKAKMKNAGVHHELRVRNGVHNWEYWHQALRMALPFASRNFGK